MAPGAERGRGRHRADVALDIPIAIGISYGRSISAIPRPSVPVPSELPPGSHPATAPSVRPHSVHRRRRLVHSPIGSCPPRMPNSSTATACSGTMVRRTTTSCVSGVDCGRSGRYRRRVARPRGNAPERPLGTARIAAPGSTRDPPGTTITEDRSQLRPTGTTRASGPSTRARTSLRTQSIDPPASWVPAAASSPRQPHRPRRRPGTRTRPARWRREQRWPEPPSRESR